FPWVDRRYSQRQAACVLISNKRSVVHPNSFPFPAQHQRPNPASVVFRLPGVVQVGWPGLTAISLVVHAVKRQGLDLPALADMEVGVFVPAYDVEEEIALEAFGFGRRLVRSEAQGQLVPAIEKDQGVVFLG